ncbi:MAG: Rieske (2Fe-2S) protein [Salinigranum sp.]
MDADDRIASAAEVTDDTTLLYTVRERETGEEREAILVRTDDGVVSWLNYCQHLTHIRLDKGSGATMRDGEIVCRNHGAYFEADTGYCNFGPCEGAYLSDVEVAVDDGAVYLADPAYAFVRRGPIERDETDLSSTSNVEF